MSEQKNKSIGGLYINKARATGKTYLSGFINLGGKTIKIVAFKNDEKVTDKTPDFSILIQNEFGGGSGSSESRHKSSHSGYNKPRREVAKSVEPDDEDIPF